MDEIELLKRRLEREKIARKQAESILESKALELYEANESLRKLNDNLEEQISKRTLALQESELKYRNVIDQASDIIYTTDEDGVFTFINPIGSNAFGYTLEEIIGKQYIDFVPDDSKEDVYNYYLNLKDNKIPSDYFEFPIRSKSGTIHWIGQNVNRIEKADGSYSYNAVARDISLRKKAESDLSKARTALIQSEVKYRSVLENMDLGLMEVDRNGIITRVYDRFCKLTGYKEEELIGKDALETFIVKEFEHILKEQDKNRLDRQSGVYEVQIKHKNGRHIWVVISGAPFYNENGEVIGSLGVHYDISERKELEDNLRVARHKAIKAQKAEQQFLANMSHEIRTPLNAIIGMSHLLQDTKLDDKQQELVEILFDSAGLLKGLVSDILDISKIDSGMVEITESDFVLVELVGRLVKTFSLRAEEKGIKLKTEVDCGLECILRTDRQWVNQILINLLSNAIKFTNQGEVTLKVKKLKENNGFQTLRFEVLDTGIGIKKSEMTYIFNSFKQANNKVRKNYGGTGLGLYISSKLVSLLGGKLEVESKENVGSKFYFTLDIESADKNFVSPIHMNELNFPGFSGFKILIVEDNVMNQKYISSLFEKWKIDFDIANDGLEAIDKFKQKPYDLIFMDLSMPNMDGYEATRIIRSIDQNQIPIIALTASTFLSKKQLALQSGMTDFLAKPFVPEDLFVILQKHLQIKDEAKKITSKNNDFNILLDRVTLRNLYQDDFGYALDMFETYIQTVGDEVEFLLQYLDPIDADSIRRQTHKMKPIFTMVGLNDITDLCEFVENNVDKIEEAQLREKCKDIYKRVENSKPIIQEEIKRLSKLVKINHD